MNTLLKNYTASFKGLTAEVWWLALITLINRAGTMVIPFLSLYLTKGKGFSMGDVAWIMSAFGLGSLVGSWLGGYLTDKFGAYKTMVFSLFSSGIFYIILQLMQSFWAISIAVFVVILLADIFRPALFVIMKTYSVPENRTRSLTLIRLAINLGFSLGPVVGGFLIYNLGYEALFWTDGLTCFFAAFLFLYFLHPKRTVDQQDEIEIRTDSPYKDFIFLWFCLGCLGFGFVFLQYFSTIPLYYRDAFHLSEETIGLLLGFNGLLIFLIEMPFVHWLEKVGNRKSVNMLWGIFLLILSFLVIILFPKFIMLWLGMFLMSFAEMFFFPFSNSFATDRSKGGKAGQYMALYSISFSFAHILGHSSGLKMIELYDFNTTWWFMLAVCGLTMIIFVFLGRKEKLFPQ